MVPGTGRLRHEEACRFEASLGDRMRPSLIKPKKYKKRNLKQNTK